MNSGVHDHRDSRVQGLLNELEDDQTAMRRERGWRDGKGRDGRKRISIDQKTVSNGARACITLQQSVITFFPGQNSLVFLIAPVRG